MTRKKMIGDQSLAGPTADVSSIAASLSLSITILSSKEYTAAAVRHRED